MTYIHGIAPPMPGQKPGGDDFAPISGVERAIARASARTGVDFSYLLKKADVESSLNPNARAKTSTATGLYQFIEKTWLQMVRDHGEKYGLGQYTRHIDSDYNVQNAHLRKTILNLRKDPETSAYMAAEYAAQNAGELHSRLGPRIEIGKTELYLAHFMGPTGASRFIEAMQINPNQRAVQIFPREAHRNPGVFYDSETGRPRTLQQIYTFFNQKFETPTLARAAPPPFDAQTQEDDMISALRNNRPFGPARPNNAANRSMTTSLPASAEQFVGETGDSVAVLEPDMVDRLLAHPPQPFKRDNENDNTQQTIAHQLAELHQKNAQARVLVLAQLMAHEDTGRYNS